MSIKDEVSEELVKIMMENYTKGGNDVFNTLVASLQEMPQEFELGIQDFLNIVEGAKTQFNEDSE